MFDVVNLGDEECSFGGVKNSCNRVTNRCIGSKEAEDRTLQCIINSFDIYQEFYLKVCEGLTRTLFEFEIVN